MGERLGGAVASCAWEGGAVIRTRSATLGGLARCAFLLCTVLPGTAWAHPNESGAYAMRTLARLDEVGLKVVVILEVPIRDVVKEFEQRYVVPGTVPSKEAQQQQIEEFTRLQWNRLAAGLDLRIDGTSAEGTWLPVDTPINGRANSGFFVYMLWYKRDDPGAPTGREVTVEVQNRSFADRSVFLSGYADCHGAWKIRENSAVDLLGAGALVKEANTNAASWTQDAAMRRFRVVYARVEPDAPAGGPPRRDPS